MKTTFIIKPDGTARIFPGTIPGLRDMQKIVGGSIEFVRVLREDITDRNEYTYMIVNDTGLLDGLPRNQKATDIYLANVRRAFPDAENPAVEATKAWLKTMPSKFEVTSLSPPGYDEDPYISGTVIWFDGWTCAELLADMFRRRLIRY